MCVIAYKPTNIAFPSETILKNCYENNPDGAGFMYALNGNVHIQKGYETWTAFKDALDKARAKTGDNVPYVMHFRIATQGYEKTMTHPFPLSSKMSNLKKLHCDANIGIAHNGILDLTSDGAKDYSDTMKFITDYLALIIRGYNWYEDDRTKTLIERLIDGSRLAILDKHGHCQLMGKGWIEESNGIFYSNSSYSYLKYAPSNTNWKKWYDYDDYYDYPSTGYKAGFYDPWDDYWNDKIGAYDLNEMMCPYTMEDDDSYCCMCTNQKNCAYVKASMGLDTDMYKTS